MEVASNVAAVFTRRYREVGEPDAAERVAVLVVAYMASPRPVEKLLLARSYAKADAAEQAALLATGEGMLATWTGTAFDVYYLFNLVTLLVLAVLMYRSQVSAGPLRCGDRWLQRSWPSRRTSGQLASSSRWPHSFRGPCLRCSSLADCSP